VTIPGFVILVLLFLLAIWIYVELAKLPGKKARERGHPQAEAISVLSWIGLLLGIVPWVVALVWAYTKPIAAGFPPTAAAAPAERIPDTGSSVEDTEAAGSAPAT
jgi:hypothetical protein